MNKRKGIPKKARQGAVIWVKNVQPIDEMSDERIRYGY